MQQYYGTVLPIWGIELKAKASKPKDYPYYPVTLGDWLKKKRMDEYLSFRKVCRDLRICDSTRHRWEENLKEPRGDSRQKLRKYLNLK